MVWHGRARRRADRTTVFDRPSLPYHTPCNSSASSIAIGTPLALQVEEALKSLDAAMGAGFDNFDQIRRDKNLSAVRASPKFQPLIERYDEPVINWNAVKATFGFFNKKSE